jgi:hypothetical protein
MSDCVPMVVACAIRQGCHLPPLRFDRPEVRPHEHLTFRIPVSLAALGYTASCEDCGQFFRDAIAAAAIDCHGTGGRA